jgi:hypothetical protein
LICWGFLAEVELRAALHKAIVMLDAEGPAGVAEPLRALVA